MTHLVKTIAASFLFTVAMSMHTIAQQSYTAGATTPAYANNNLPAEADEVTSGRVSVNTTTQASFTALFPNASNLAWGGGADNYWVSFLNDGRKANASFTAKGKMKYSITACDMQHLPATFAKTIASAYAGYTLFNAIEIKAHGAVAYQAVLENSTGFTTLKYTTDGVEKIQQVKK